jgi:AmpD protein
LKAAERIDANGWLMGARRVVSPNCDPRPAHTPIDLVVVHSITLPPGRFGGDAIERLFTNSLDVTQHESFKELEQLRVSAHFLIRRDGELLQFVPCQKRAWHAGVSSFEGRERCNDFSIGIELEGTDVLPFTHSQYACLELLLGDLQTIYPLFAIAAHSEIAPGRKTDPGPQFDWSRVTASQPRLRRMRPPSST